MLMAIPLSCVQEIEVFKGDDPNLVVDGLITNDVGPQKVKLSFSKTYNTSPSLEKVDAAVVTIADDLGNEETLTYSSDGVYLSSPSFVGVTGRSYKLKVILESGATYESDPELMNPVPAIETIRQEKQGVDVVYFIDFQDDPERKNYYRWKHSGSYEMIAPIAYELATNSGPVPSRNCFSGPRPVNFSRIWKCWVMDFDLSPIQIGSDQFFNGRFMEDVQIFSAPIDRKYDRGYYAEIQQYSLSKEAYDYWNAIETQTGNNGTIFETNNYQIRGNLHSPEDPKALVLGYFGASAVFKKSIFVNDYSGLTGPIGCEVNNSGCYPERCLDCLRYAPSATNVKPDFWPL